MTKPVILTGLRANNNLTIGNYFGAMLPMIDMAKKRSDEFQINMFIPDLHSFTTPINHDELFEQVLNNARLYVAAGLPLDNDSIYLYRQSYIPAHSELAWVLDCFTGFGEMSRMIQFKDKSSGKGDSVSVGLFNYPVLMAADILLYNASYIPVGEDQTQHLEFARDIGERLNNKFADVFPDGIFTLPAATKDQHSFFGKDQGLRIKDLINPEKKMSKSDESGRGVIFLSDDPEVAYKKVVGATTDDRAEINFDRESQPGISNLIEILSLTRSQPLAETIAEFQGQTRYGDFKKVVASEMKQFLTDFQQRLRDVDDSLIMTKLEKSEAEMNIVAKHALLKVQQAVGLRPREA